MSLDNFHRYSRQYILPGIGEEGQDKLLNSKVLIVGLGALGVPVAQYLAGAGIGCLGLADADRVEIHNLHRQVFYRESDVGNLKVDMANRFVSDLNSQLKTEKHPIFIDKSNAKEIISKYDLVLDCSDNFETRYLLNDVCFLLKKPLVFGAVFQFTGQVSVFNASENLFNYRDIYPNPPGKDEAPDCSEAGVIGALAGVIGSMQALESIKVLLGDAFANASGKWILYDGMKQTISQLQIEEDPENALRLGEIDFNNLPDYKSFCGTSSELDKVSMEEALELLENKKIRLIDVRSEEERAIKNIGGEHVPLQSLHPNNFSSDELLVFYCASGIRSDRAVKLFKEAGFSKVKSLYNGIS